MDSKSYRGVTILLIFISLGLFLLDLALGSVYIPFNEILKMLVGADSDNTVWSNIFYQFRLPRALAAVLVGAGLGISGLQMQTLFRNPLAGPFVLGISSGASLGVAFLVLASFSFRGFIANNAGLNNWMVVFAACAGSGLVFLLVLALSYKIRDSIGLLIIGIMVASITGAVVGGLQFFSNADQIQIFLIWTFGSLGGVSWNEHSVFIPVVVAGMGIAFIMFKPLNALLLGENYAQSLGLNIKKTRALIIISTGMLAGAITAFCGPIAFIGLAVPHITRLVINTGDHKVLIPSVAAVGIMLMIVCDIISQIPGRAEVLPINIVTSLVGAPVVIWIILRKRGINKAFS